MKDNPLTLEFDVLVRMDQEQEIKLLRYSIAGLIQEMNKLRQEILELQHLCTFEPDHVYTSKDVQQILNVSEKTLIGLEQRGVVPYRQFTQGGTKRYLKADILKVLEQNPS